MADWESAPVEEVPQAAAWESAPSVADQPQQPVAPQPSLVNTLFGVAPEMTPAQEASALNTAPGWMQKSAAAIGNVVKSQIPTSQPGMGEIATAALPLPLQMGIQGAQLGAENVAAAKLPLGSQEQYNVAAKDILAVGQAALPFLHETLFPRVEAATEPITESVVAGEKPPVQTPAYEAAPVVQETAQPAVAAPATEQVVARETPVEGKPEVPAAPPTTESGLEEEARQITGSVEVPNFNPHGNPTEEMQKVGDINAVQEPSTGEVLQRQPEETGVPGGERGRVEQGVQGQETPEARQGVEAQPTTEERQGRPITEGEAAPSEPPAIGKEVNLPGVPAEEQKTVGLTKDFISEDRKARGEAPLSEQARQTNPETWDNAEQVLSRNPNAGHELVASLIQDPRAINPDEAGVLLRHRVDLSNQTDLEYQRLTSDTSTPSDKGDAAVRLQALTDARDQADKAVDIGGTQLGRSLQFLQKLSTEDYSLSGITQMRRAAMGGQELTPEQTAESAEWAKDILAKDKAWQDYQKTQSQQESALKAYKTRLQTATTDAERKLAFSEFAPEIRRQMELDPEAERLKAERDIAVNKVKDQIQSDQMAARPMWQKVLAGTAWAARESALSGYHTLAKLAGFSAGKLAEIPLTQTAERVWGQIPGFKDIAAQSELGPGANAKALGQFYTDFFTTGMKQAWQQLRTGTSDFKAQYEDSKLPLNYPSFFGNLHGTEKTPLRVGVAGMTRERIIQNTMQQLSAQAVSEGHDITDPIIQAGINKLSWDAGTNEILMGNNLFASKVNDMLRSMEAPQKATGEPSPALSVLSTLAKSFLTKGIVRTPANFVTQVFERTPAGLAYGVGRGVRAIAKGVENVSPGESTAIMRLLGVGSVGSGMFLWGALDALKAPNQRLYGGYYQPGEKRDPDDVKFGSVRPFGWGAPHYLTHNLLTEPAQMGNTMMRVALSSLSKKDRTNKGLVAGAVASTLGLAEQAPIANPAFRIQKLAQPGGQSSYFADLVKGLIPQLVQNIAQDTDKAESRKPTGVVQTLKTAIPGLREQVPVRSAIKTSKKKNEYGF